MRKLTKMLSAVCTTAMIMTSGAPAYAKIAKHQNIVTLTADQDMKKKTIKKGESFTLRITKAYKGDKVSWNDPDTKVIKLSKKTKTTVKITGLKAGSSSFNYVVKDSTSSAGIHTFTVKVTGSKNAKKRMAMAVGKKKKVKRVAKERQKGKK